jgi:hypothetical protein
MTRTRNLFKALGLFALVLGLMAIVAGSAQAEPNSKWTVGGTDACTLKAEVQLEKLLKLKPEDPTALGILLTKIGGAQVWFLTQTTPELIGAKLECSGSVTSGFKVRFLGVTTDINIKSSPVCTPLGTPGNDGTLGTITTEPLKGLLVLHEVEGKKVGVVEIKPKTGNVFANLFFGEECSLPEEMPIIGLVDGKGVFLKEPRGTLGTEELTHEFTENSLTELWAISETAEHKATLDGTAVAKLGGTHASKIWKGTPG